MAQLFRKSAVEKLSSPEQLDKSIVITKPLTWLALIGVVFIITCFIVWSVYGTMPDIAEAQGIISNGVYTNSVYSHFSGKVADVYKEEGDYVKKDDVLCTVIDANDILHNVLADEDCIIAKRHVSKEDRVNFSDELFGISPCSSEETYVVFYVGIEKIPGMCTGMDVILNAPAYDNQKYGHMKGQIIHIDNFATTEKSVRRVIGENEMLVDYIGAIKQPVVAVTCNIQKDTSSENGFWWSNEKGEQLHIRKGSIVNVKVVMDENAPITKLIPGLEN